MFQFLKFYIYRINYMFITEDVVKGGAGLHYIQRCSVSETKNRNDLKDIKI